MVIDFVVLLCGISEALLLVSSAVAALVAFDALLVALRVTLVVKLRFFRDQGPVEQWPSDVSLGRRYECQA
jgi:hypothetical protein